MSERNWVVVRGHIDDWTVMPGPPEAPGRCFVIYGTIHNSPDFEEGHHIRTSPVVKIENGRAYTMHSVYTLGKPAVSLGGI